MPAALPNVVILMPVCDDFIDFCALSCVRQTYGNFKFYILDDSKEIDNQKEINVFCKKYNIPVIRRNAEIYGKSKSGNLRNFLNDYCKKNNINWDYLCLADADTLFLPDFLEKNLKLFYSKNIQNLGVIQSFVSAFDHISLYSRICKARICKANPQWIRCYADGVYFLSWGCIISKKAYVQSKIDYIHLTNDDTHFWYAASQANILTITSPICPTSSIEPYSIHSFCKRDLRWHLAQIDFFKKDKIHKRYKRKHNVIESFFKFVAFPNQGYKLPIYLSIFSTTIFTLASFFKLYDNFVFWKTETWLNNLWILFGIFSLILFGFFALLSFVIYSIRTRSIIQGLQSLLAYLNLIAIYNFLYWIYFFTTLNKNKKKTPYIISEKKYKKITLSEFFRYNKKRLILTLCLLMAITSSYIVMFYWKNSYDFVAIYAIISSLFIQLFFVLWILFASLLTNWRPQLHPSYNFYPIHTFNRIRQKFGFEKIPVCISPRNIIKY